MPIYPSATRITFLPGAITAGDEVSLPNHVPAIATIISAKIWRHVSVGIDASATAGDKTAFVGLLDGGGGAVTGVSIAHAGGGTDIAVNGALTEVAVTATKHDEKTVTLSVNTLVADELLLVYEAVGDRIRAVAR